MKKRNGKIVRLPTGVRNLDAILGGGLPRGSMTVLSGPPGSGKTILAQQVCFNAAANDEARVLYFNTLSEPTAKTLRYLAEFSFFDPRRFEAQVQFVDMGVILRAQGLQETSDLIMEQIKKAKPSVVVLDSFKAFDDLSKSKEELRKFGYGLAVQLMAWEVTGLLLGEYAPEEYVNNPLFSVVDGLITMSQREASGEQQRFLQALKMRGTSHSRDEHTFEINDNGVEVFAPRVTIHREPRPGEVTPARLKTGIARLDDLLGEGIPRGSSLLIAGVAGTGKTVLSLEFILRGAQAGEKGIMFSFEETTDRLLASAKGMGWELAHEIERGMVELVFIAQPQIAVESHLLMMRERVAALGAQRVAVDSVSVFLHKVRDPQISREKVFQLATIIQNAGAVGFLCTDVPYGSNQISRFGVEETVVDGVILLSSTEEGLERSRYLEVYKLRNTAHLKGRHNLVIGRGGIKVFPRYSEADAAGADEPALDLTQRLPSGIPGLDALIGGGLIRRSSTIVAGSTGIGKSTFGMQFIVEGAERGEPGVILTLEESRQQLLTSADARGIPLRRWTDEGVVEVLHLAHEYIRPAQLLTILSDAAGRLGARRLFLDSASNIAREGMTAEQLRQAMFKLAGRFKALDVTSLFALESTSLAFTPDVTERGFSAVADNLLMLRYVDVDGEATPALRVVKTRGSVHDRRTFTLVHEATRVRIGEPISRQGTRSKAGDEPRAGTKAGTKAGSKSGTRKEAKTKARRGRGRAR